MDADFRHQRTKNRLPRRRTVQLHRIRGGEREEATYTLRSRGSTVPAARMHSKYDFSRFIQLLGALSCGAKTGERLGFGRNSGHRPGPCGP